MKQNEFTEIGFIRKANGFKGEVMLALHHSDAGDFAGSKFLFLEIDGRMVPFFIESFSDESGNTVVKFEDISTHEDASALMTLKVFLPSHELSENSAEDSFNDLVGYSVIDKIKGMLGTVKSVSEMPGQVIIAFDYSGAEILLPLHYKTLMKIRKKKKELHVILPDGLLEVYINSGR